MSAKMADDVMMLIDVDEKSKCRVGDNEEKTLVW